MGKGEDKLLNRSLMAFVSSLRQQTPAEMTSELESLEDASMGRLFRLSHKGSLAARFLLGQRLLTRKEERESPEEEQKSREKGVFFMIEAAEGDVLQAQAYLAVHYLQLMAENGSDLAQDMLSFMEDREKMGQSLLACSQAEKPYPTGPLFNKKTKSAPGVK